MALLETFPNLKSNKIFFFLNIIPQWSNTHVDYLCQYLNMFCSLILIAKCLISQFICFYNETM